MRIGVRRKIFFSVFATIFAVIALSGYFLTDYVKDRQFAGVVDELDRHVQTSKMVIESVGEMDTIESADRLADRLGKATDARVTIIRSDGKVIGDSSLGIEDVRLIENHGNREEVLEAVRTGLGNSERFSETLETYSRYAAATYTRRDGTGIIRVSKSTSEVSNAISNQLRTLFWTAAILGLVVAILVSTISAQVLSRTLSTLVNFAKDTAEGNRKRPIDVSSEDDLGGLAGSLNRLAEQVELHVTTLAEERDRFETVLDGMNDAVLALDEKQRVTLVNPAAIMLLGLGRGPIGKTLLETINVPALHDLVVDASRESSGESTAEFDLPGGQMRRILARASSRRIGGVVVVLQDVTELRHLETLRKDFVSNVSHELRTPVSIMSASAETLLAGAMNDKDSASKFLSSILANAERLSAIIADLLDISQIEDGKYNLAMDEVSVALAMKRAAAALETHAIEKNFNIKVEPSDDIVARADKRALDQILFNFTDNAVKYTGAEGNVVLRAKRVDGKVRIEVEDNGPGIEPEYRERLFERFYRVDPGRSREMGGTGLGLAIVKHLATAMGGRVGMEPAAPTGSTFFLELDGSP